MPFVKRDAAQVWWRSDGHEDAPPLLLGNSLGTDMALWDPVMPALTRHFRVLRFDKRGHGASQASPGDYTIEMLGRDALAVADAAGVKRFRYAGISIGGMIGLWLASQAGDRVERAVLSHTSAQIPSNIWAERMKIVREQGMAALVDGNMQRWFKADWLARNEPVLGTFRHTFLHCDPVGYLGCCAAIRDMQLAQAPAQIRCPVLVVTGADDPSTPKAMGEAIAAGIQGAKLVQLPTAHIAPPVVPEAYAGVLVSFLTE